MSEFAENFIHLYTKFISQNIRMFENFKYKGKTLGSSAILLPFISSHPDCSMKNLIEYTNAKPSTLTRKIDKLVKFGLIQRKVSANDRRVVLLNLTSEGNELKTMLFDMSVDIMQNMTKPLGTEKLRHFFEVVSWLVESGENFELKF